MGLNQYQSPFQLWEEKTNKREPEDISQKEAIIMGHLLEPVVAQRYIDKTGYKVQKNNHIRKKKGAEYLLSNVDRDIVGQSRGVGILEIKTTTSYIVDPESETVPLNYFCQIQHYFNVRDKDWGEIAVLIDGRNLLTFPVEKNQEFIDSMEESLYDFWFNHVKKDIPPPKIAEELTLVKSIEGESLTIDNTDFVRLKELKKSKKQESDLKKSNAEEVAYFKEKLQDKENLKIDGQLVATFKSFEKSYFNAKQLELDNVSLYNEYYLKKPARSFLIKKI